VALCCLIMAYPGIENDEALFASVLYPPKRIPLMLMSYVGTLKTFLYKLIFPIFAPSVASIRLPPVIAGAVTIWLFYLVAMRIAGLRAAVVATVLFSTDVMFILTNTFDWGPVALQHVLLVGGLLAFLKFHESRKWQMLGLGCFLFGLAAWDKALFLWSLGGIGIATMIVFPREVIRHLSLRNFGIAAACFIAGSAPLLLYNVRSHGGTIVGNASLSPENLTGKVDSLRNTLDGTGMLGYITFDNPALSPRKTYNEPLLIAATLLLPLLWFTSARRPLVFAAIFLFVTWIQMALTKGTGGSVHHVVLLWPIPFLFIALALAQASQRLGRFGIPILAGVIGVAAWQNFRVYEQYRTEFIRHGVRGVWTDAMYPLNDRLKSYRSKELYIVDWGLVNPLRALGRGGFKLHDYSFDLEAGTRANIVEQMGNPDNVFIDNTPEYAVFKTAQIHLSEWADEAGYKPMLLETVNDSKGRPVYQLFSYRR
jgi:hypothetical protein